jgi:hypothetical protein
LFRSAPSTATAEPDATSAAAGTASKQPEVTDQKLFRPGDQIMSHDIRRLVRLGCCLPALAVAGCGIPLATLHGPTPMPANTSIVTGGFGPIFLAEDMDQDLLLFNAIFGAYGSVRHGVTDRLEVGGSAGMFNGVTVEAKYNVVPGPFAVSANVAASSGVVVDLLGDGDGTGVMGLHPALLVGTERVYGGAKLMIFTSNPSLQPWQVVFAGGSFGRGATRLITELGHLRDPADGETVWFGGIALRTPTTLRSPW